jgi:hypothetical protein
MIVDQMTDDKEIKIVDSRYTQTHTYLHTYTERDKIYSNHI